MSNLLDRIEENVTLVFFWVMSIFVLIQIVSRYIMHNPLSFPDEIARYAYVWMTFIGLSLATKHGDHIRVDLIRFVFKGRAGLVLDVFVETSMLALLIVLAVLGWKYVAFSRVNRWSALPVLSMALVTVAFPLGCSLAAVRTLQIVVRLFGALKKGA